MGTHPIFESDFDCLTERGVMSSSAVEAKIDDKSSVDIILDQVTWYRWFLSLMVGPIWGILAIKGLFGIALYGCCISLFSLAIVNQHGTSALEKVGGANVVLKEGGLAAFAAFCVTWIITNTVMNS